jgi:hypothetical protein
MLMLMLVLTLAVAVAQVIDTDTRTRYTTTIIVRPFVLPPSLRCVRQVTLKNPIHPSIERAIAISKSYFLKWTVANADKGGLVRMRLSHTHTHTHAHTHTHTHTHTHRTSWRTRITKTSCCRFLTMRAWLRASRKAGKTMARTHARDGRSSQRRLTRKTRNTRCKSVRAGRAGVWCVCVCECVCVCVYACVRACVICCARMYTCMLMRARAAAYKAFARVALTRAPRYVPCRAHSPDHFSTERTRSCFSTSLQPCL